LPATGSIWKSTCWRATLRASSIRSWHEGAGHEGTGMNRPQTEPWRLTFHELVSPTEALIEEARNGRMFILVDDEDRENEGDIVIRAQRATAEAINFMAKHGRGMICLALPAERVHELGLPLMSPSNESRHRTAFTVSIEAREGITTGISAPDRARTIAVAI